MRNPLLLVLYSASRGLLFCIPVITIFWSVQIGMSQTDIMILQAVFSIVLASMEFPTGYIADRIGYRNALVLSALLCIGGWIAYSLGRTFAEMIVAESLLGVGIAFHSGADSALLFQSLAAEKQEALFTRYEGRLRAATTFGEAASSSIGGWLYTIAPRLPMWLQIPGAVLSLIAAIAMRRPPGESPRPRSHLRHVLGLLRTSLWTNRRLSSAIWLGVMLSLSTFFVVWLIQPYMKLTGVAEVWFGPIWAAANLWVGVASLASGAIARRLGLNGALLACVLLVAGGYGLLAITGSWWGFSFYFLLTTLRGVNIPLVTTEMMKETPEGDRASVLSLKSMLFRFAFVAAGPAVGLMVDRVGMHFALAVLGLVLSLLSFAAWLDFRRTARTTS